MGGKRQFFQDRFGLHDKPSRVVAIVAAAVLLLNWAAIVAFLIPRAGSLRFLRLHYTAALGVDWVAEWWKVFAFPLLGVAVFFVNGVFSGILSKKHPMLGLVILFSTAAIEMILAGGGIMAILLNS